MNGNIPAGSVLAHNRLVYGGWCESDLVGREAKCEECGRITASSSDLQDFAYRGPRYEYDSYVCAGGDGWRSGCDEREAAEYREREPKQVFGNDSFVERGEGCPVTAEKGGGSSSAAAPKVCSDESKAVPALSGTALFLDVPVVP